MKMMDIPFITPGGINFSVFFCLISCNLRLVINQNIIYHLHIMFLLDIYVIRFFFRFELQKTNYLTPKDNMRNWFLFRPSDRKENHFLFILFVVHHSNWFFFFEFMCPGCPLNMYWWDSTRCHFVYNVHCTSHKSVCILMNIDFVRCDRMGLFYRTQNASKKVRGFSYEMCVS